MVKRMNNYLPEGKRINLPENKAALRSPSALMEAAARGQILEARAAVCDSAHNLIVELPFGKGLIPRLEGAFGIADGTTKDIALISRVNKPVCFIPQRMDFDANGEPVAILSRRAAQDECIENYHNKLSCGDVIPAKVTHLEPFGCFVDIGCGIPSLIPIDAISVSRISHPNDRFYNGQDIQAVVWNIQGRRITLTHKELLGTWLENAQEFSVGETVGGIVRSVETYGIFIELAPNFAGLAEYRENVEVGQAASVYIKALIPEKMKVKLIIVDVFESNHFPTKLKYYHTDAKISRWIYSTPEADKRIETNFSDTEEFA